MANGAGADTGVGEGRTVAEAEGVVVSESGDVATTWILHDTCRWSIECSLKWQKRERRAAGGRREKSRGARGGGGR